LKSALCAAAININTKAPVHTQEMVLTDYHRIPAYAAEQINMKSVDEATNNCHGKLAHTTQKTHETKATCCALASYGIEHT
jgi:hypothetical protein